MSRQSLLDTAMELEAVRPPTRRPSWRGLDAIAWALAAATAVSAAWLVQWEVSRQLLGPDFTSYVSAFQPGTAAVWLVGCWGLSGLLVGAMAGAWRGQRSLIAAGLVGGFGSAVAAAVAAVVCLLAVAATSGWMPPQLASTLALGAVGAVVGLSRYTWGHPPGKCSTWRCAGATGWGLAAAAATSGTWILALVLSRLLFGTTAKEVLLDYDLFNTACWLAASGGIFGVVVGGAGGVWSGVRSGKPSPLAAGVTGGACFGLAGALGGGLCPLVVVATAGWLTPEAASTLALAALGATVGVVGYTRGRPGEPPAESEFPDAGEVEWSVVRPADDGPPPAGHGATVRVAPVLMVSATCLAAMLVSPVSPVGWAMLAVGALGLAVAWALTSQERRIRELEVQLQEAGRRRED
jgi:hypothetical protein